MVKDMEKQRADARRRYQKDKEKIKARVRAYAAANREKVREGVKAWKAANPEKVKAQEERYRAAHKEELNAKQRTKYRERNPPRPRQTEEERRAGANACQRKRRAANLEAFKARDNADHEKYRHELRDSYVRNKIGLRKADCPPELVVVKRAQIKLIRLIRKMENEVMVTSKMEKLRDDLTDALDKVLKDRSFVPQAAEASKIAGKIISSCKLELDNKTDTKKNAGQTNGI